MKKHLAAFDELEWISADEGIRYKKFEIDGKIIRLMELSDTYCDKKWCMRGHMAVIMEGEFLVRFEDHEECFVKGDTVLIPGGEAHKHIASVPKGKKLVMISFEI